jgi:V/A-type H+-transporting ATPase subunit F
MGSFLISDNRDTLVGMRLAGIRGVLVSNREQVLEQLNRVLTGGDVQILLITVGALKMAEQEIKKLKLERTHPLIVEIPGPEDAPGQDSITAYIREALGAKL